MPVDRCEVDAELLREPADERRRPDTSLGARPGPDSRTWPGWTARVVERLGRSGGAVLADDDEHRPDRDDLAFLDEDLRDLAGGGRRDLDGRLVGLDLDERLVLGDLVALGDEPAGDLAFGQALAEVGKLELVRHGGGIYRGRPTQASGGSDQDAQPALDAPDRDGLLVAGSASGATSRGT